MTRASEKSELVFERLGLTSERSGLASERPGLALERLGLASVGPGLASKKPHGVQRDRRMYRWPLYSTGLCPLRFPLGPLPCQLNCYHQKITKQGKGTDDHLLPWATGYQGTQNLVR